MFDNDEIDWVSFSRLPLPPAMQKIYEQNQPDVLIHRDAASTFSYFFHTGCFPFNNVQMRRAFGLALNRAQIVERTLSNKGKATTSVLPPAVAVQSSPYFKDGDVHAARALFDEALALLGIGPDQLPEIVITHLDTPLRRSIANETRVQWEAALPVRVRLEELSWDAYFKKITYDEFHICGLTWYACFHDPAELLDCFKYSSNKVNCTHWQHPDYIRLIEMASKEPKVEGRKASLQKVESLLIEEMPIIPLYSHVNTYLKKPRLKGVQVSQLGVVNFKSAYIDSN